LFRFFALFFFLHLLLRVVAVTGGAVSVVFVFGVAAAAVVAVLDLTFEFGFRAGGHAAKARKS